MKKIPTIFQRDYTLPRKPITHYWNDACTWVRDGHGVATRKWDGTCCLWQDGKLWKRREVQRSLIDKGAVPDHFLEVEYDHQTRTAYGWVPVGDGPEDRWHREALEPAQQGPEPLTEGQTYELVGPKINGGREPLSAHVLIEHGADVLNGVPLDFLGLRDWLRQHQIEGIVWHLPGDGRMAKIKRRDFGLGW